MELLDTSIANVALPHIAGGLGRSLRRGDVDPDHLSGRQCRGAAHVGVAVAGTRAQELLPGLRGAVHHHIFPLRHGSHAGRDAVCARIARESAAVAWRRSSRRSWWTPFRPKKRASAFALYTVAIVTAPAIGPVLGGWITDNYNWRWVFLINIPIGLLSMFLSSRYVMTRLRSRRSARRCATANGKLRVDGIGIALIGLGSAALEILLDRGQIDDWFGSSFIAWMFAIASCCLVRPPSFGSSTTRIPSSIFAC
jgi:DHA2 family multidrug resistance protein